MVYIRCVNKCIKNNQYYEHSSHPTLLLPPLRLRLCMLSVACGDKDGVGATTVWGGSSVHNTGCSLYIYLHNVYTPSLVPMSPIFSRCIRTRGPLANRRAGLLKLAVSPASLRGWRRRRLTPSPYIFHYILPHTYLQSINQSFVNGAVI